MKYRKSNHSYRILAIVSIIASLSLIGVVYGNWNNNLNISGTLSTGSLSMNAQQDQNINLDDIISQSVSINEFDASTSGSAISTTILMQSFLATTDSAIYASSIITIPLSIKNEGEIATKLENDPKLVLIYTDFNGQESTIDFNNSVYSYNKSNEIYSPGETYSPSLDIYLDMFIDEMNYYNIDRNQLNSLTIKLVFDFKQFNSVTANQWGDAVSGWQETKEIVLYKLN